MFQVLPAGFVLSCFPGYQDPADAGRSRAFILSIVAAGQLLSVQDPPPVVQFIEGASRGTAKTMRSRCESGDA